MRTPSVMTSQSSMQLIIAHGKQRELALGVIAGLNKEACKYPY